jgi:hypothetical protein
MYMELLALCELDILNSLFFTICGYAREPDMDCIYYAPSGRIYIYRINKSFMIFLSRHAKVSSDIEKWLGIWHFENAY